MNYERKYYRHVRILLQLALPPLSSWEDYDIYGDTARSAIFHRLIDNSLLRSRSTMRDCEVKGATGNILRTNTDTRPGSSLEACDLIDITGQSAIERSTALIGRSIEIEALDARCETVLEPIDDREITRQVMPQRLFDLLAARKGVEFPDSTLCGNRATIAPKLVVSLLQCPNRYCKNRRPSDRQ